MKAAPAILSISFTEFSFIKPANFVQPNMFHLARIFVVLVIGVNSVKCQDGTDEELAVRLA